ncbi:MAG: polyketide cyclase [Bacteroidetes bacterium]|nr:MAG: polyketide cyclase [Bacteroidota bacterium]
MRTFETQRPLPFTAEQIFNAFRDPALLAQWWGPKGFTNTFNRFEFTPGGRWSFVMHAPDGKDYPNESIFKTIEPPRMLVIRHDCPPYFTLTVTITPEGGGSVIAWRQEFDSEETARNVAAIVIPGNEQNLDRLEALLSNR